MGMRLLACVWPIQGDGTGVSGRQSALEGARRMAEVYPADITVLAPDAPGGEDALRRCLALAADRAWLVRGPIECGFDIVSVSQLMAAAVTKLEAISGPFDVIFCGDADPGQDGLGPALAGWLGYPQVTGAYSVECAGGTLQVRREWDDERSCLRLKTPCVVSCLRPAGAVIYPELSRLMAANRAEIPAIEVQPQQRLHEMRSFRLRPRARRILDGGDAQAVAALVDALGEEHVL